MEAILTYPLIYCGLLAAVLTACLYLFISVKRDLAWTETNLNMRINGLEQETGRLASQAVIADGKSANLAARIQNAEERLELLAPFRGGNQSIQGIDLNQRTQVLRRARRGDRPEQISAELGVPRSEVELLYKVQRAVARSA